jgi:hypothetical protein
MANDVRIGITLAAVFPCTEMFLAHETVEKASMKNIFLSMENLFSSPFHYFNNWVYPFMDKGFRRF